MAVSADLALFFPVSSLKTDFEKVQDNKRFKITEESGNKPDNLKRQIDYLSKKEFFNPDDFYKSFEIFTEFQLEIVDLENLRKNIPYNPGDKPSLSMSLGMNHHGGYLEGNGFGLGVWLGFTRLYYIYNFLSSRTVEELLKTWIPIYGWSAYEVSLYKDIDEHSSSFLNTPWRHYSDTMIFGPDLVSSLNLKDIDWQHEDVFFAKWVTEDILWLASPYGFRSRYEFISNELTYDDFYNYFEYKSKPFMEKHRKFVTDKLNLSDGIWYSY